MELFSNRASHAGFHPGSRVSAAPPWFALKWHSLEFVIRIYLLQVKQIQEYRRKIGRAQSQQQEFRLITEMCNLLTKIYTVEDLNRQGFLKCGTPNLIFMPHYIIVKTFKNWRQNKSWVSVLFFVGVTSFEGLMEDAVHTSGRPVVFQE